MDDLKELLRQVKRIELRTRRAVSDLTAGAYKSRFRGQGMEFEEVRDYVPGDDVRQIDWNVTARAGKPYIKLFQEERELTVMLLFDLSGSMRFGAIPGFSPRSKLATAAEIAAIVAITALRNKDKIGMVGFTDRTHVHIPARSGQGHAMRLVREILEPPEDRHRGSCVHAIEELMRIQKKHCVCFLVSDFLNDEADFHNALARARRRHDVIGLRVGDPAEAELPKGSAPLALQDPEGPESLILASGRRARRRYHEAYQAQRERITQQFRKAGCDLVDCSTAHSTYGTMQRFFQQRRRRR